MAKPEPIAQFSISITSAENASWQGIVQAGGAAFRFQSELQLLNWLLEQYPALRQEYPEWKD